MATSRSSSESGWIAGAFVFSGRPDPTWSITTELAEQLQRIWESLDAREGPLPESPGLGYRGSFVRDPSGRVWEAYGGVVTLSWSDASESRRDDARPFELMILASAPEGTLPPTLVP